MPDLIVNILYFGNLPNRDVNVFATRLAEVYTSCWSKKCCGFSVSAKGNMLTVSKNIKGKEKEFTAVVVYEPYSGDCNNLGTLREWANKYELIVMICPADEYQENRIDILRVRNVMMEEKRRNDSILVLTAVENVMETIGECRNDTEKAVAIYSALTGSPYSSKTKLKGPSFLLPLYGEDSCQYKHRDTGRTFSMPINLLCDLDFAPAYEPLLAEIVNRMAGKCNMRIIGSKKILFNNHNNIIVMKLKLRDLFKTDKNDIRLAVVGTPAAGKTYFLEDVVSLLTNGKFLNYRRVDSNIGRFRPFSVFKADTEAPGYRLTPQTPNYACRHKNHYCSEFSDGTKTFKFSFLDIPGEAVKKEEATINNEKVTIDRFALCSLLYDGLKKSKKKLFIAKTWKDSHENQVQTIELNGKTNHNPEDSESNNSPTNTLSNTYQTKAIDVVRHREYATKEDVLSYMETKYKCDHSDEITGEEFINNFYDFDADSIYNALVDLFPDLDINNIRLGINEELYKTHVAYNFYFYHFLFNATDIVLVDKILNNSSVGQQESEQWFNDAISLRPLRDLGKNIYLGIKGADTFFDKDVFKSYYENIRIEEKHRHNIIYSAAAASVGKTIGEESEEIPSCFVACKTMCENCKNITPPLNIVNIDANAKQKIEDALDIFKGIIGESTLCNIPQHTYFIATPVDDKYTIDEFGEEGIMGRSKDARLRCFFGSLQLMEDVMKNRGRMLPQSLDAIGDFLNFIRGTDRN